jgi:hypothetical protein
MSLLRVALALVVLAGPAHAACPDGAANCLLHEEGVKLLTSAKFEEAAAKFQASLAAGPTARAALGYAQAIEGQGKIALAYESMLYAKQLSDKEVAGPRGQEPDVVGRAERIRYKLAELRTRVGFVQIKLPPNVPPRRLVSVRRKGEGDLVDPLLRWVVVAPEHQQLVAFLDDGSSLEVDAQVGAGMQGSVVIPVPAVATQPNPTTNPIVQPQPVPAGAGNGQRVVTTTPIQDLYKRDQPKPSTLPPPELTLGVDFVTMAPGPEDMNNNFGAAALVEKRLGDRLGLSTRLAITNHPPDLDIFSGNEVSGLEIMAAGGLRTRSRRSFYLFSEAGITVFRRHTTFGGSFADEDLSRTYPTLDLGAATRLGRFHAQAAIVWAINVSDIDLPVRFMLSLGFDLVKRQ